MWIIYYKSDLFTSKSTHTILWLIASADDDEEEEEDVNKWADISAGFCSSRSLENKPLTVWWWINEWGVNSGWRSLIRKDKAAARRVHDTILISAAIRANVRSEVS